MVYYLFVLASVSLGKYDRLPTQIYAAIDHSLLFFVTIRFLGNEKDARTLLKGVIFAVFLMGVLVVIGYAVEDPWWGQQVFDDERVQYAKALGGSYYEQLDTFHRERTGLGVDTIRTISTASNPNALGLTMLSAFPLVAYFWFRTRAAFSKLLLSVVLVILVANVALAASRTAIVSALLGFLVIFLGLLRVKEVRVAFSHHALGIAFVGLVVFCTMKSDYLSRFAVKRLSNIDSVSTLIDANDRIYRWKRAITNLSVSYLVIGRGHPGSVPGGAHSNYLGIVYMGGIWALAAFATMFFQAMRNSLQLEDRLLGILFFSFLIIYAVASITQACAYHNGPGYIFWPVMAMLANREAAFLPRIRRGQLWASSFQPSRRSNHFFGQLTFQNEPRES